MSDKANGSLIVKDGKPVRSSLIGQSFSDPKYFWSRPSATGPTPYNAAASSGSNLGPTNPALMDAVKGRVQACATPIPAITNRSRLIWSPHPPAGCDPHISPAAAEYQAGPRGAGAQPGIADVRAQAGGGTHGGSPRSALLGEPRVNVLELELGIGRRTLISLCAFYLGACCWSYRLCGTVLAVVLIS